MFKKNHEIVIFMYFRLVNAFKSVTIFSVIYVVGAQLSLFNMISAFGVPFYKIYVRFGLGFVYDVRIIILVIKLLVYTEE